MPSPLAQTFAFARTIVDTPLGAVSSVGFPADASAPTSTERHFLARYENRELLGEGGMGEVRLYRDARIGRDVAVKMIRQAQSDHGDLRARFLREARIQGQLEHPAIVPVYDMGIGDDGAAYFSMKRVRGLTFADIVDGLRAKDATAESEYPLRKLLTAFASVCLAIELAHTRSVVHRDLKPGNIMLGNFGEVYVLDWGIAKVLEEPDDDVAPRSQRPEITQAPIDSGNDVNTQVGTFLGTLGFSSPEQLQNLEIDGRSDVYALGAILFEMLTLLPLHEGTPLQVARSTLDGANARCSERAPTRDIPPELEAVCVKATATAPSDRFTSARALHDAVQKYLDGDRDAERRRALAAEHAELALTALKSPKKDAATRAMALTELGRSVALDPANDEALGGIVSLLLEPPTHVPDAVRAQVDALDDASMREINTTGLLVLPIGFGVVAPSLFAMGIKEPRLALVITILLILSMIGCLVQLRKRSVFIHYLVMIACAITFAGMTRIVGPLVFAPTLAISATMIFAMYPFAHVQRVATVIMLFATLGPLFLEWQGVLPSSYLFRDDQLCIVPQIAHLPQTATMALLAITPNVLLVMASIGIRRIRKSLSEAERRLALQAWQFRQLVPERARHRV